MEVEYLVHERIDRVHLLQRQVGTLDWLLKVYILAQVDKPDGARVVHDVFLSIELLQNLLLHFSLFDNALHLTALPPHLVELLDDSAVLPIEDLLHVAGDLLEQPLCLHKSLFLDASDLVVVGLVDSLQVLDELVLLKVQ